MIELVRCNACWWMGHDGLLELVQCEVDGEACRGCPHCRTDHHLMDVEVGDLLTLPAGFDVDEFHDFVVAHGFGPPTPEGYVIGLEMLKNGDSVATAAAEVVARGLTNPD